MPEEPNKLDRLYNHQNKEIVFSFNADVRLIFFDEIEKQIKCYLCGKKLDEKKDCTCEKSARARAFNVNRLKLILITAKAKGKISKEFIKDKNGKKIYPRNCLYECTIDSFMPNKNGGVLKCDCRFCFKPMWIIKGQAKPCKCDASVAAQIYNGTYQEK